MGSGTSLGVINSKKSKTLCRISPNFYSWPSLWFRRGLGSGPRCLSLAIESWKNENVVCNSGGHGGGMGENPWCSIFCWPAVWISFFWWLQVYSLLTTNLRGPGLFFRAAFDTLAWTSATLLLFWLRVYEAPVLFSLRRLTPLLWLLQLCCSFGYNVCSSLRRLTHFAWTFATKMNRCECSVFRCSGT